MSDHFELIDKPSIARCAWIAFNRFLERVGEWAAPVWGWLLVAFVLANGNKPDYTAAFLAVVAAVMLRREMDRRRTTIIGNVIVAPISVDQPPAEDERPHVHGNTAGETRAPQ